MVISAAARAAAKITARAAAKARDAKKITKAKVRKHVGSVERRKDVHHEKVLEKEGIYTRKKGEPVRTSEHPIESSLLTVRGPAKAKSKGKVKLSIEKHSEREKIMQEFPKDPTIPSAREVKSPAELDVPHRVFQTPLHGKFKQGQALFGVNVKTKLAKTPKHKLKLETAKLKVLFPEEVEWHTVGDRVSPGGEALKTIYPKTFGGIIGKKSAISYRKKDVSTKGDIETIKKKKYELEVFTQFQNKPAKDFVVTVKNPAYAKKMKQEADETGAIISHEWMATYHHDPFALARVGISIPQHGKWFGRKRVGISLTGKAQTKRTKGGKLDYQTSSSEPIDETYFGVSFKPRDQLADKRLKDAGVFKNPKAAARLRAGSVAGTPRKLAVQALEPWEQMWKPKVVEFSLPSRFEVAAGVTVATGVSFTAVHMSQHKKSGTTSPPKKKKGGKR